MLGGCMRLKKLELYGFKSFAARTEIVFGEGITGIVGPNGSGKSNIGDAVRWVLGEQSAKTLRGSSMSDVIFNGTQTRKPLSYCEVSLFFDNTDRSLPMDFSEIMVTRRVYRNGESEYYLNQSSCRLKDVIDLFRDTGIGKEGYSIIGQGRIDEILSRKSEDRRQVFEEAAGIVKYKARKEEADRKLEHTLLNEERIDDILEELSKRLEPLEKQSKAARQYLEWSKELKVLDLNLFLIRSDRLEQRIQELKERISNVNAVLKTTQTDLNLKNDQRNQVQEKIEQLVQNIHQERETLTSITDELHQTEQSIHVLNAKRETREEHKKQLLSEIDQTKQKLANLEDLHHQSYDQTQEKVKLLAEQNTLLNDLSLKQTENETEEEIISRNLENNKQSVIEAMNRASATLSDQTRLNTMKSQMENRLSEINQSLEHLREQSVNLQTLEDQCVKNLNRETLQLQNLQNQYSEQQNNLNQTNQSLFTTRTAAEKKSSEMQALQSRYRLLTEMSKEMEGYNHSVRHAVQYAKEHHIQGVHGVLAGLINVPEKYEIAIDMALGGAIQNIVTDQEETAKQIIDYLRQNRLGRATFLPISAISSKNLSSNERSLLSMPGCIGIASELITYKQAYRGIVENLLGRTIIADNLEHGISIMRAGHHSFRLVTLQGDVIHSGGSMTGGSVQSKMTNLLGREREIKQLSVTLQQGKEEFDQLKIQLENEQNKKSEINQKISELSNQIHQQEIAIAREQDHVDHANSDLQDNLLQQKQTEEAILQLTQSIQDIDNQLNLIFEDSEKDTVDQKSIESQIDVLQNQLNHKRNEIEEINNKIIDVKFIISDLNHDLDIIKKDSEHYETEKKQLLSENQYREKLILQIHENDKNDTLDIQKLTDQMTTLKANQLNQQTTIQNLEDHRSKYQNSLNEFIEDIDRLHNAMNRDSETLHSYDLSCSKSENDLKSIQDKIWTTYELTYGGAEEFRVKDGFSESTAEKRSRELNNQIRSLGVINVASIEEYTETKTRYDELFAQQTDLKKAETDIRNLIQELIEKMESTFVTNFSLLQNYFKETFVRLFGGGHAEIELTDPDDPLNCGIEVNVQPPGKKLQLLSLLSGGERALTAIAILFAMLKLKPTPFCILDEIEAALDDANIGYYADYLKEYSQETQFIVVTHRKGTMERCNSLYGVAMEEQGVSKMVSVSLQDYQEG